MGSAQSAEIEGRTLKVKRKIADGTNSQILQVKSVKGSASASAAAGAEGGENMAVKRILLHSSDHNAIENAKWEIKIHKSIPRSPYIVSYEASKIVANPNGSSVEILILMEYCGGGTLAEMIRNHSQQATAPLSVEEILKTFSHVCTGVAALHSAKPPVIHRDIRPENVWLHESGVWKLGDFGSATQEVYTCRTPEERIRMEAIIEKCTHAAYRAPEMIDLYSGTPLSPALDIWALGCLLYVLLFNQMPFPTGKLAILSRKYTVVPHHIPQSVITFMEHMLTVDAKSRPTIVQVQSELKSLIAAVHALPTKATAPRPASAGTEHKHSAAGIAGGPNAAANGTFETDWDTKKDDGKNKTAADGSTSPHNSASVTSHHPNPLASSSSGSSLLSSGITTATLDTNLQKALHKATAHDMVPPKAKHVKALIQASWGVLPSTPTPPHTPAATDATRPNAACKACKQIRFGLPGVISTLEKRLLMKNDIIVFKCLQTLHKLISYGAPEVVTQMNAEHAILARVKKAWTAQNSLAGNTSSTAAGKAAAPPTEDISKTPVADLLAIYADYLERRIVFCHKYPRFEGNFAWGQYLAPMLQDKDNQNAVAAASLADTNASSGTGLIKDPNDTTPSLGPVPMHNHVHSAAATFEYFARDVKEDGAVAALLAICAHAIGVGEVVVSKAGLNKESREFRETVLLLLIDDMNSIHRAASFELTQLCLATGITADVVLDSSGNLPDPNAASPPVSNLNMAGMDAPGGGGSSSMKNRSLDEEGSLAVILRPLFLAYKNTVIRMGELLRSCARSAVVLNAEPRIVIQPFALIDLFAHVSSQTAIARLPVPSNSPALKVHNTVLCARLQEQMKIAGAARLAARSRRRAGSATTEHRPTPTAGGAHSHSTRPGHHSSQSHHKITFDPSTAAGSGSGVKLVKTHSELSVPHHHSTSSLGAASPFASDDSAIGSGSNTPTRGSISEDTAPGDESEAARKARIDKKRGVVQEKSKSLDRMTAVRLRIAKSKSAEKGVIIPPPEYSNDPNARRKKSGTHSPHPSATPSPPLGPTTGAAAGAGAKGWAVDWDDDSGAASQTTAPPLLPVIYAPTPNVPAGGAPQPGFNPLPVILSNDGMIGIDGRRPSYDAAGNSSQQSTSSGDVTSPANVNTALHSPPQLQQHNVPPQLSQPTGLSGILNSFDPLTPQHRAAQAPSPMGSTTPTNGATPHAQPPVNASLPRQGSSEKLSSLPPAASTGTTSHQMRVVHRPPGLTPHMSADGQPIAVGVVGATPHSPITPRSATDRRTPSPSSPAPVGGPSMVETGPDGVQRQLSADDPRRRSAGAPTGTGRPDDVFALFDPIQAMRRNTGGSNAQQPAGAAAVAGQQQSTNPSPTHASMAAAAGEHPLPPQHPPRRDSYDASQPGGVEVPRSPRRAISPQVAGQSQPPAVAPSSQHPGARDVVIDSFAALELRNQLLQRQEMERRAAAAAGGGAPVPIPQQQPNQVNGAGPGFFSTPFGVAPQQSQYYTNQANAAAVAAGAGVGAPQVAGNASQAQYYSVKAPGYTPSSAMGSTMGGPTAVPLNAQSGQMSAVNTNMQAPTHGVDPATGSPAVTPAGGDLFANFNPLPNALATTVLSTRNPRAGKVGAGRGTTPAGVNTAQPQRGVNGPTTAQPPGGAPRAASTLTNALTAEQQALQMHLAAAAAGTGGAGGTSPSYPPPKYQTNTPNRAPPTAINNNAATAAAGTNRPGSAGTATAATGATAAATQAGAAAPAGGKKDLFGIFDPFQDPAFNKATAAPANPNTSSVVHNPSRHPAGGAAGGVVVAGTNTGAAAAAYQRQQMEAQQRAKDAAAAAARQQPQQSVKPVVPQATPAPVDPNKKVSPVPSNNAKQQPTDQKTPAAGAKSPASIAGAAIVANAAAQQQAQLLAQQQAAAAAAAAASNQSLIAMGDEDTGEIDFTELSLGKRIGMGAFAEVFTGVWRGTDVAIKKLIIHPNSGQDVITEFKAEVKMLRKLRHPHIVLFMAASTKLPNLCVVTELLQGSLFDLLHNSNIKLSWKLRLQIALDTARGMTFLHLGRIVHRDLKSPNLLLDAKYRVKVADFGLARTKAVNTMTGQCGTFQWMAPEVIESTHYTEKADVFSFAIILWELVARQVPYSGMNAVQVSVAVMTKDMRPPLPDKCPPAYAQLIRECWDKNPDKRPAFPEVVERLNVFVKQASNPE